MPILVQPIKMPMMIAGLPTRLPIDTHLMKKTDVGKTYMRQI